MTGVGTMRVYSSASAALIAFVTAGLVLPRAALAQATAAPAPAEEEAAPAKDESAAIANATGNDIMVTATKREQILQKVPVAITVTTAATIELAHIRDIEDLATLVPSLRVGDHLGSGQTGLTIRGLGNGTAKVGGEPSIGVFIDGVYHSRPAAQIEDFADVAQVEVLRGPQSTLFGKNALAGVINIRTPEPKFKPAGNAEISYGNYNAVVAKAMVTGPLSKDVAASVAAGYDRRDGTGRNVVTGAAIDNRNRWFVHGQLLYEPDTQLKLRLIADYGRIQARCCAAVILQSSAALPATGEGVSTSPFSEAVDRNLDPTADVRDYGLSAQVEYSLGPLTVTSISAWRQNRYIASAAADFANADLLDRHSADVRVRSLTQELRAATNMEGPLNFIAGAFYINQAIHQTRQGLTEADALHDSAVSIFGQVDFKPLHRLTLTAGVDYTHDGKNFSSRSDNAVEPGQTEDGDIAWTARAAFDASDRIKFYLDVSTGFTPSSIDLSRDRRPAASDAAAVGAAAMGVQSYGTRVAGPEHALLYEGGVKASWQVATMNLAIFRQSVTGFQTDVVSGTGFDLVNGQRESVYGFELEGMVHPVPELTLSQALTYLHPRYDRFTNSSAGDGSGTIPAGIPPIALTAAGSWDHPRANGDHLILRGDWHHESATLIDAARRFLRKVSQLDGSLTYRWQDGLEVSAWGRNLSNNRTITAIVEAPAQPASLSATLNAPRTYGVSARYKF